MNNGAVFPLKKFLGNFSGHEKAGRIEKVSGGYRLTPDGIDYFADRFNPGNRQHVSREEVGEMMNAIKNGGAGWEQI